jgi:DNA-binding Lrp family transcriptional regulator
MVSAIGIVIARLGWISAFVPGPCFVLARLAIASKFACLGVGLFACHILTWFVSATRYPLRLKALYWTPKAGLPETSTMVPFFVQFKCKLGQSYAVANALAEAEIASEIYSTAGDYDLLVKFYVDNDTDIGHFVNERVQTIPGIQDTHTIITFKAFGTG